MHRGLLRMAFLFGLIQLSWHSPQARAAQFDCNSLDGLNIQDGQIYYRSKEQGTDTKWQATESTNTSVALSTFRGSYVVYVIKDIFERERSGVLVVKTGNTVKTDEVEEQHNAKKIHLSREGQSPEKEIDCRFPAQTMPESKSTVTAKYYDYYHDADFPLRGPEGTRQLEILNAFHSTYRGKRLACKTTNSAEPDSILPWSWDFRSNRSQYSFDPSVVATGLHNPLWKIFHFESNGSMGLKNQTVKSIRYETKNGRACVSISVQPRVPGYFIRINDLEGRNFTNLLTTSEKSITFTEP